MRGADQMFRREDLFTGRDVVCLAGEQVERDLDVLSATVFAQPDEFTLGETIRLEQFLDRLQIVASGQIDGFSYHRSKMLAASDAALVRDVLIEVDIFAQILFAGTHILPAGEHDFPHPPWHKPTRYTGVRRSSTTTLISAR
jgi:hypothetical protein